MRVIDLAESTQINDVALGQNLELQISIDPPNSVYDFRAVQLIAKSDTGHNSIMLLDKRGCPTDLTVFPQLEKRVTNTSNILFGRFHAFKFSGSSFVNFDVIIQFCLHECVAVNCGPNIKSYGRKRRALPPHDFSVSYNPLWQPKDSQSANVVEANLYGTNKIAYNYDVPNNQLNENISEQNIISVTSNEIVSQRVLAKQDTIIESTDTATVTETSRNQFTDNKRILKELVQVPLQIKLNVRVPEVTDSESLIYGENSQILVAGIGNLFILFNNKLFL